MRMKGILLASTALALAATATEAQAGDLYLSVFGGWNQNEFSGRDTTTVHTFTSLNFSNDSGRGFIIGGAIGTELTNWAKGLRVELEAAYRRNDVDGAFFLTGDSGSSTSGIIEGNASTFSVMANVWYDIDVGSKIRPYVGGGVGWARSNLELVFVDNTSRTSTDQDDSSGFTWQLGLGFNYAVAPNVDVGLGYRFQMAPRFDDIQNSIFHNHANVDSIDNENHSVLVNLTIGIN